MTTIIRPATLADAEGIAHVHIASWRTTYRGIISDEVLTNLSFEQRLAFRKQVLSQNNRRNFSYVAVDEAGRIIGFIDGGPTREQEPGYEGELYAIYLLQECQGQGIGKRLVQMLFEQLVHERIFSVLVRVLSENPARYFYAALDAKYVRNEQIEIGGKPLDEDIYGWSNIRDIPR
jgi:ribosomal protein S18 acetylase RimI-like enzyme